MLMLDLEVSYTYSYTYSECDWVSDWLTVTHDSVTEVSELPSELGKLVSDFFIVHDLLL